MPYTRPRFRIMGDAALLGELGDGISAEVNDLVGALWNRLETERQPAIHNSLRNSNNS